MSGPSRGRRPASTTRAAASSSRGSTTPIRISWTARSAWTRSTGALKEGAMGLMERVLPKPSHDRKIEALLKGMKLANSFGITSVQNCSGGQDEIDLYAELQKDDRLTVRTSTAFPMPENPVLLTDSLVARIQAAKQAHHDHFVRAGTVKFFAEDRKSTRLNSSHI